MKDSERTKKMKTILILTQYFYKDGATGQVLFQLSEDLVQRGYDVKVITGHPNYIHKKKISEYEILKGIQVWRVNYLRLDKNSKIGRILGYLLFPLAVLFKLFFVGHYDSVLVVSNPPTLPLICCLIKKIKKINFTFLLHDLYPDVAIKMGVISEKNIMARCMNWGNKKVFKYADHIVTLGQDAKQLLIRKGIDTDKIHIITNWADKTKMDQSSGEDMRKKLNLEDRFVILYTGNLGLFHSLDNIVYFMKQVNQFSENIFLVFIGEGGRKTGLQNIVKRENIHNVSFLTYQDENEYGDILRSADVLLVSLAREMEGISVPSKIYSYLAAGRPILAVMSEKTEAGSLIEQTKSGIRVEPNDTQSFIDAVKQFYRDEKFKKEYGRNARRIFEERYERKLVTSKFINVL